MDEYMYASERSGEISRVGNVWLPGVACYRLQAINRRFVASVIPLGWKFTHLADPSILGNDHPRASIYLDICYRPTLYPGTSTRAAPTQMHARNIDKVSDLNRASSDSPRLA